MHIITNLPQVIPRATIHQQCLVASPKEMPGETMPPIKSLRVGAQKPLHPGAQIGARSFHYQMKMIVHQTIGMNLPLGLPTGAPEKLEKKLPVHVISYDCLAPIAPTQDMIDRSRIFNAQRPRHDGCVGEPKSRVNT
jgi:hypothetical protein